MRERNLILAIDVGTTNCKAALINRAGQIVKYAVRPVSIISVEPGWSEICPNKLWSDISDLIQSVSQNFKDEIITLGISVQRNTFITWDKNTGEYMHNFITWMDKRSSKMCSNWNDSYLKNIAQWAIWALGLFCRSPRMLCASTFNVKDNAIPMRLKWVLLNNNKAATLLKEKRLCFGTIETWLVWKLTQGRNWVTEYSCASCTGLFDIWQQSWSLMAPYLFGIPLEILPPVKHSNAYFGRIDRSLGFGFSVPIRGVLGDQQASMFGNLLFDVGNTKLTLGTVISCNVNTGIKTHPSAQNIYPLIGWKLKDKSPSYIAELFASNGGKAVEWTVTSGLVRNINEIDSIARKVSSSDGVSFIPAFNGTELLHKDSSSETSLFGITFNTNTSHIVRAVLESQAFLSHHVLEFIFRHYNKPTVIIVDGGTSRSSLILESLVQLSAVSVKQPECVNGSLMGAGLLAGLGIGIYHSLDDIKSSVKLGFKYIVFDENSSTHQIKKNHHKWKESVKMCVDWSNRKMQVDARE